MEGGMEGGREGGMDGERKKDREGGRVEERERVESCFLNLNTCVGRVQGYRQKCVS